MLPELQAEQQLLAIEAVSVPHMTDQSRREVLARYTRRARGAQIVARSAHQALMEAGVRVVEVPAAQKRAPDSGTRQDEKGV